MKSSDNLYPYTTGLALITGLLLLIPLIAMQFTDEVVWTLGDFIFAGILIFGTGLAYKLITIKAATTVYKVAVGLALVSGFILIWANAAVGIIGSESNPINLAYFGVILVGFIGAFIARFKPRGMVYTMFAMTLAQALVTAIALIGGFYRSPPSSVIEIIGFNGFFIVLFAVSALMFRYDAQHRVKL